jgi:AraC-like DNA-binding protein
MELSKGLITVPLSRFSNASPAAGRFVRFYVQREVRLGTTTLIQPVPARAAQMLDFEFGDPIEIRPTGSEVTRMAETATLIGIQTYQRAQLLIRGNVETFVIVFRPAGIYQLFGLPALENVNLDHAAHAVFGAAASDLQQRLGNAHCFQERVQIADQFITGQSFKAQPAADPIEAAANEIVSNYGVCRIDCLVRQTGLAIRNFQRMFQQRVGVSPKLFARIARFESALKAKALSPQMSWTNIAHEFGYHDHMHMVHDFRQLSGQTPTGILEQVESVLGPQIDSTAQPDPNLLAL